MLLICLQMQADEWHAKELFENGGLSRKMSKQVIEKHQNGGIDDPGSGRF